MAHCRKCFGEYKNEALVIKASYSEGRRTEKYENRRKNTNKIDLK